MTKPASVSDWVKIAVTVGALVSAGGVAYGNLSGRVESHQRELDQINSRFQRIEERIDQLPADVAGAVVKELNR